MDRNTGDLGWSDEQWSRASKIVQQEAQKARVAAQFLPISVYGDSTAVAVPKRALEYVTDPPVSGKKRMKVDSDPTLFFTSLAVNIFLTSQEAGDPEQGAALIELRRAANMIARLEDALMFRGRSAKDATPDGVTGMDEVYVVKGNGAPPGLVSAATVAQDLAGLKGEDVAKGIIDAIGKLEAAGQNRPFACVLDQGLYSALHTPTSSMILPRDRVVPFLEGPLLRSSTLPENQGIVVALGGSPLELVISSELHVQFLQISQDPYFVLRVSERIALRVTDGSAIALLKKP
jgi:uncharacterized linocin/CFP29 family protein